jgi:hypothetical protein
MHWCLHRIRIEAAVAFNVSWLLPRIAGGGGGGGEKDARHQEDIAKQNEESQNILDQFLAQLVPGSDEYNRLQTEGIALVRGTAGAGDQQDQIRQLGSHYVSQQQARIAGGGPATALEARTNLASQGLREAAGNQPWEEDLLNALRGQPTTTAAGDIFRRAIGRAQSPTVDDDVFKNALKLVEDQVNTSAAGRGILGGGLRLEQLGRSGVEAAIAEAQRQDTLRQEAYENAQGLFSGGEALRNRQIGLEEALTNLQLGRETNLTGLLSQNTNLRLDDMISLLERRTTQSTADRVDAEEEAAASRSGLWGGLGTGIASIAAAPFTGGASLLALPGAAGRLFGGPPQTAGQIQATQQGQTPSGAWPNLSRNPTASSGASDSDLFAQFLQWRQSGGGR